METKAKDAKYENGFVVVMNCDEEDTVLRQIVEITRPQTLEEFQEWFYCKAKFQKLAGDKFFYFKDMTEVRDFLRKS